jgi:hypothetical protein
MESRPAGRRMTRRHIGAALNLLPPTMRSIRCPRERLPRTVSLGIPSISSCYSAPRFAGIHNVLESPHPSALVEAAIERPTWTRSGRIRTGCIAVSNNDKQTLLPWKLSTAEGNPTWSFVGNPASGRNRPSAATRAAPCQWPLPADRVLSASKGHGQFALAAIQQCSRQ